MVHTTLIESHPARLARAKEPHEAPVQRPMGGQGIDVGKGVAYWGTRVSHARSSFRMSAG
jgi:hypothetical protein